MTAVSESRAERSGGQRRSRWVVVTAAVLLLLGIGAVLTVQFLDRESRQDSAMAQQRAQELEAGLVAMGVTGVSAQAIENRLGAEGGVLCTGAIPGDGSGLGALNGAAGPGIRPSVIDPRLLAGERLIIEIYCPERLDAFDQAVARLDLGDRTTVDNS